MSKNVTITEGKRGRTFGGTERLETEQPDGTSCFWVPEDERRLDHKYVIENGDYYPDNYAMSEINVNVIEPITGLDGIDWEITIDDIGVPHIEYPDLDVDLSIDPITGLPDISIGGIDIDLPDIDGLLDLDEDIDISLDVDLDTDMDISLEDIDLDISGVDLDGLDLDVSINLDTLDIELTELPDEIRIMHVPDKTAYKDGETIDLEGIVVQAYRNGEVWEDKDGKYHEGYVPAHELIAEVEETDEHVAIDEFDNEIKYSKTLSGGGVEFYDPYMYAPATYKNLSLSIHSRNVESKMVWISDGFTSGTSYSEYKIGIVAHIDNDACTYRGENYPWHRVSEQVLMQYSGKYIPARSDMPQQIDALRYMSYDDIIYYGRNGITFRDSDNQDKKIYIGAFRITRDTLSYRYSDDFQIRKEASFDGPEIDESTISKINSTYQNSKAKWNIGGKLLPFVQIAEMMFGLNIKQDMPTSKVIISWPRPKDNKLLTASFDITVEEDNGTHHSGTWGDDETGHWGGTTIGEDGGSHYSGKF